MSQRLQAFADVLPTLPKKRAIVWETIRSQGELGATLADLVRLTGWQINRLSGRVTELRDAGYLREAGTRGGQTIWVACLPQEPIATKAKRQSVKAVLTKQAAHFQDLFGNTEITVRIPFSAVKHLAPGASIIVKL